MNQVDNTVDFKIILPMEKSDKEDGWYITGIAAGLGPDKQNDELTPEAIRMLADQINSGGIMLKNFHEEANIAEDLGVLTKATVTPDFQLSIDARLDEDNPDAAYLWKKINKDKKFGFSILGQSIGWYYDVSKSTRSRVRKHPYIVLKHVGVTTRPVYTPSLGTVIRKAIDEADASLAQEGEIMETPTQNGEGTTVQMESSAPEKDTSTIEKSNPSPSEELVKALMANEGFTTLIKSTVLEQVSALSNSNTDTNEDSSDDSTQISKSETDADSLSAKEVAEIVKSAVTEVGISFTAQLQALADRIPENLVPTPLVKSDQEQVNDFMATLSDNPRERLRLGLAARTGELDKLR